VRVNPVWLVLALAVGCGGTGPSATGLGGQVVQEGQPVRGALVFLSEEPAARTETDADGRFALEAAPGRHEVTTRYQEDDGAVTERRVVLTTGEEKTTLVELPRPARIEPPSALSPTSARIRWSQYAGADFREYKVYRAFSAALDETTGQLLHVGMARGETELVDTHLLPGQRYFYRVFVMDDFGRLAGSNIIRFDMPQAPFLVDGDFESTAVGTVPEGFVAPTWNQHWEVSDARAHSGKHAMRATGGPSNIVRGSGLEASLPREWLIPGARYRFSFWYLREAASDPLGIMVVPTYYGDVLFDPRGGGTYQSSTDTDVEWQQASTTFIVGYGQSGYGLSDLIVSATVGRFWGDQESAPDWIVWFDDLKVERVPDEAAP
jgi:hypothetical protein